MLGPISGLSAVARRRHGSRGGESRSFGALLEGPSSARPRYPSRHFSPSSSPRPHRRSQRGWTTSWWPPSRASLVSWQSTPTVLCEPIKHGYQLHLGAPRHFCRPLARPASVRSAWLAISKSLRHSLRDAPDDRRLRFGLRTLLAKLTACS